MRSLGGALFLVGALLMVYNIYKTVKAGKLVADEAAEAPALSKVMEPHHGEHWHRWIERKPVQMLIISLVVILIGGIIGNGSYIPHQIQYTHDRQRETIYTA